MQWKGIYLLIKEYFPKDIPPMPGRNLPLGCCQVDPLSCGVSVGKRTVLCMALLLSVNLHVQILPFF